jgi:hypothetical protein
MNSAVTYLSQICAGSLLVRGAKARLLRKYPFFYFPLACSLLASTCLSMVSSTGGGKLYARWYWDAQFLTMFVACGNIIEILRHGFAHTRGARDFGLAVRYALYVAIMVFGAAYLLRRTGVERQLHVIAIERDFRMVQAVILLVLLAGLFYFGIPLGRNLNGIFLGYGIYIGVSLMTLALESNFHKSFYAVWALLQPLSYLVSLIIYLFSLWTYRPASMPRLVLEYGASDAGPVTPTRRA